MYRGSRHLDKIIGPYSRPEVPTSAARVGNASVGAESSGGQSWNVQSGRYNKPAGCSTPVACRGRPWKQTKKTIIRQTFQYVDMTCSVADNGYWYPKLEAALQLWTPYCVLTERRFNWYYSTTGWLLSNKGFLYPFLF
jgi:hypothetical protein